VTVRFARPTSLQAAFEELQDDDAHLLAGGVSVVLLMNLGLLQPGKLVSLAGVPGLRGITRSDDTIEIGALVTHDELARSAVLAAEVPAAADLFTRIGNIRVRCAGTLGGNLAHADPAQDPAALLAVLDAEAVVAGPDGERTVAVAALADGPFSVRLAEDEILTSVRVPVATDGARYSYIKFLSGSQDDYATVSVACRVALDDAGRIAGARLAAAAVGGTVVLLDEQARLLEGTAPDDEDAAAAFETAVRDAVDPAGDRRGSADYKRHMAGVVAGRAARAAATS
jgi:aerobic carbon-monoxide dehydrogenase medium subunit